MKLYSGPLSLFTAKVRVALAEKELPYERIEVGWSLADRYLPHHPDVEALNPKGEVPVLVDGDLALYDSTVILEYLEDRYPDRPLYPQDPTGRARCRQLEAFCDETLFLPVWDLIEETFYPSDAADSARDSSRLEAAKATLAEHHAELDKRLAGRDWLCDSFSVADISAMIFLGATLTMGAAPAADHTHLLGWLARCSARPSIRDEMAGMVAASQRAGNA